MFIVHQMYTFSKHWADIKRLQFIDARKLELNLRPCTRYYRREHYTFPLYLLENFTLGFLATLRFTFICVFGEVLEYLLSHIPCLEVM